MSNAEAQLTVAGLNRMPAALRVQEFAALMATDEKQYLRMVAELSQHGLDRPAQALAVVVGNEALTDLLASAQTQGRAKLRKNATDGERAAVTGAVRSVLERIASEEGIDASGFGFAVEDLAFQFFNITGDAETAAEDAAALFGRQLETIAPEERIGASDANAPLGDASITLASGKSEEGGDEEIGEGQIRSTSNRSVMTDIPLSGATGPQERSSEKEDLGAIEGFRRGFNKIARGVLMDAYEPAVGLLNIANSILSIADLRDMREGIEEMVEGARNTDASLFIKGRQKFLNGTASLLVPGSDGQVSKIADDLTSRAKEAFGRILDDIKGRAKSSVRPDEKLLKESAETIRAEVSRNGGRVKDLTGDIANDEFTRGMKERPDFDPRREIHPPYVPGTKVHDIEAAGSDGEYVRVISPNKEGKLRRAGMWLMRAETFNEIVKKPNARERLKNLFALPTIPTHFSHVYIPKGEALRVGVVNGHQEWGRGGAVQYEILCGLNAKWFEEEKVISQFRGGNKETRND